MTKKKKAKRSRKPKAGEPVGTPIVDVSRRKATKDLPDEYVWDERRDGKRPTKWRRSPPPIPCPECHATRNAHGSQALICTSGIQDGKAYVSCRVCFWHGTVEVQAKRRGRQR